MTVVSGSSGEVEKTRNRIILYIVVHMTSASCLSQLLVHSMLIRWLTCTVTATGVHKIRLSRPNQKILCIPYDCDRPIASSLKKFSLEVSNLFSSLRTFHIDGNSD